MIKEKHFSLNLQGQYPFLIHYQFKIVLSVVFADLEKAIYQSYAIESY
jgi:hypothetical protein